MPSALRDLLLSFCPAAARRNLRPDSPARVVHAAMGTGLLQFFAFAYLLVVRYSHFVSARASQWGPVLGKTSEVVQSGTLIIVTLEFLLYPVSLLLLYFCLEGLVRFTAGLISSDVVPSLPVVLAFRIKSLRQARRQQERARQLPTDVMTALPDGRVRIATAHFRPTWSNPNLTISIHGEHYELERMDKAALPRPFVFFLRPAAVGKILRAYEEYDAPPSPEK